MRQLNQRPMATRTRVKSSVQEKISSTQPPSDTCKPLVRNHPPVQSLLHMDECNDPNCTDLDQLRELQKSLDRFTDYDHYEKCCDGHHHGKHHHEPCCDDDDDDDDDNDPCLSSEENCDMDDCEVYIDDCDECVEKHAACYEEIDVCEDDCEQCEEECEERGHDPDDCPQNHPTTRDNCSIAHELPLPLLGPTDDFDMHGLSLQSLPNLVPEITPCTDHCYVPTQLAPNLIQPIPEPAFDVEMDHWQTFVQKHHCAPDPCLVDMSAQLSLPQHIDPAYGFSFGCDPSIATNRYSWQQQPLQQISQCAVPLPASNQFQAMKLTNNGARPAIPQMTPANSSGVTSMSSPDIVSNPLPIDRVCQWLMPCGSICGATYSRTEDLKKHVKNSHGLKGTKTCRWASCTASFASEAALTGHISKKHLSPIKDEEGPWKCTFPSCNKSFMYKQVRDEHVASHNGGNRMHCPICHQWLNAEGSNFRRHMASHGPKNEHMKCRFESLGCRRRFPRLDNLRRHESCCKFGKKAAGVHHHHHRVHVGHNG